MEVGYPEVIGQLVKNPITLLDLMVGGFECKRLFSTFDREKPQDSSGV